MRFPGCIPIIIIAGAFFMAGGCNNSDDQLEFEQEAFAEPDEITRTDETGEILDENERDWRIAPMYAGPVWIDKPAYPNPTRGDDLVIELNTIGPEVLSRITVVHYPNLDFNRRRILFETETGNQTFFSLPIVPRDLDQTRNYEDAIGKHRIFIFDGNNNLITYGDIKIE